jgi:hypothetical protein
MARNVIIRPLYNRPEMLCLSIEYEIRARECLESDDYITIFAVEHGADPLCLKLIERYPFEKIIERRPFRYFGWRNIPEAFRKGFEFADNHVINIEDDSLVHKTFFKYVKEGLRLAKSVGYSVLNSSRRFVEDTDANKLKRLDLFEGPSCVMNKYFFEKYVSQYANEEYYKNRNAVIHQINERNNNDPRSKYRKDRKNEFTHVGWDGMVNRLIDTASIEEDMHSVSPFCDRQIHIGFYGFNRKGKFPSNSANFAERVSFLEDVIKDTELMARYGGGGYKDYKTFSEKLDSWDGTLYLE